MTSTTILVIGDSMLDRYWSGTVDRISQEAPVPVLWLRDETARPGGAANVAVNAARLGARVHLATLLGDDAAGAELVGMLRTERITFEGLQNSGIKTTVKIRHTARRQQLLRTDIESMPHDEVVSVFTRLLVRPMVKQHRIVVLSDYAKGALGKCDEIIAAARAADDCTVLVDPKGTDWERYRGAWLIKPNEAEFEAVVGPWSSRDELTQKADALRVRLGIEHLLITRGEHGMLLFSGRDSYGLKAEAREVYDVSGAGDTVIATLAVMLSRGMPLVDAVVTANRAAGIVVGKFGTASVSAEELEST